MKTFLSFLGALAALFSSTGCVSTKGAGKDRLPPAWVAALPKSGSPVADVAGMFVELGEQLDGRYTRDGTVNRANLSTFLASKTLGTTTVRRPSDHGATVELRRVDDTHLELVTRVDGNVTGRATHEFKFEKDTGTMVLHRGESLETGSVLVGAYVAFNFRLWRGADQRLYAHGTRRAVGQAMLMPVVVSNEVWYRWELATPEALQRQAAALAAP